MLVVMAVKAEKFPIAPIRRIIAVIMIPVMDGQFPQVSMRKFAGAAAAYPRINLQRPVTIALITNLRHAPRSGNNAIKFS